MKKVLLLILLIAFALSLGAQSKDITKLGKELHKWQQFQAEGVVQVNYQMFSLRKFYVLTSANNQIRIDMIEGGLFGASPEPLFSAYIGDYIAVRSPLMPQVESMLQSLQLPDNPVPMLQELDNMLELYGDEIIAKRELDLDGTQYVFNKRYQLTQIINSKEKLSIKIEYKRNHNPDQIVVNYKNSDVLSLMIDKIKYQAYEITKLPPNSGSPDNRESDEPDWLDD